VIESQTSGRTDLNGGDASSDAPISDVLGAVAPGCAAGLAPLTLAPLAMLLMRRRR
jgi:hypothetical protein